MTHDLNLIDQECHENHENDRTKQLKPILNTLRKAEILFFTIGFAQLLEIYAGVSLSVQYAYHFPIQMWSKIDAAKSEILALSNDWIWKDEELKLAGIGKETARQLFMAGATVILACRSEQRASRDAMEDILSSQQHTSNGTATEMTQLRSKTMDKDRLLFFQCDVILVRLGSELYLSPNEADHLDQLLDDLVKVVYLFSQFLLARMIHFILNWKLAKRKYDLLKPQVNL